ncbi:MAG: hypothetical protein U1F60_06630 [Planctomycetota bacterium]
MPTVRLAAAALALLLPITTLPAQLELPAETAATAADGRSGTVRLLRFDDLRRTFGFTTGRHGYCVQGGAIKNQNSQLSFGARDGQDHLLFGAQGAERSRAIDLGDPRDDTLSSTYYGLTFDDARAKLLDVVPSPAAAALRVELGHVFLVQIDDAEGAHRFVTPGEPLVVVLRVVDHEAGRMVEVRWHLLNTPLPPLGDPKTLPPLPEPAELTAEGRATANEHLDALRIGDPRAWPAATTALVALRHVALPLVANALAGVDLKTAAGCAAARRLEQVLAEIGVGLRPLFLVPLDDQGAVAAHDQNVAALRAWRRFALRFAAPTELGRLQRERRALEHR